MKDYAFVFDMDGVLVDSNPYHRMALKQFCEKYGHPLNEQELRTKIYGRTNKEWITALFGVLPKEKLAQYAEEKEALYRQLYQNEIKPVEGLLDFLQKLDRGKFKRAIGTSAPRANVDFTLSGTNTSGYFSIILDESNVTYGKPNPEIYINVARALKLPAGQCIVFEDSLSGIVAGKEAGCKVVGITTTHTAPELASADVVIDNFNSMEPGTLIHRIFGSTDYLSVPDPGQYLKRSGGA